MTKHLPPNDRATEPTAGGRRRSFSARFLDSAEPAQEAGREAVNEIAEAAAEANSPEVVTGLLALRPTEPLVEVNEHDASTEENTADAVAPMRALPSPEAVRRRDAQRAFAAFDRELASILAERGAPAPKTPRPNLGVMAEEIAAFDAELDTEISAAAERQAARAAEAAAAAPVSALGEMLDDADWRRLERAARRRRRKPGAQALDEVELLDEDVDDDRFEFELAADRESDELALGADIARQRRVAVALASAGIAAAVMVALLATPDASNQPTPGAAATVAALAEDGDPFPIDATPSASPSASETAAIQTASVASGYLSRDAMIALLRARPVKCVLPTPLDAPVDAAVLEPALRSSRAVCAETVDYRAEGVLFTQRSRVEGDAVLEVNAPYSLEGAALCHHTRDLSALVIGDDVPLARKVSLERLVKSNYAATPGGRICYKFRPLFGAGGEVAYGADVFVNGVISPERTDPRPFLMRRRD